MIDNVYPQPKRFDVEDLNYLWRQDEAVLIDRAEQAYEEAVRQTAEQYLKNRKKKGMILISGPSGSGKTTSSYRLTDELKSRGLNPVVLSLDNFFRPAEKMPRNKDGSVRYDSVQALDLSLLNRTLWSLVYRRKAEIPVFDFVKSRSDGIKILQLESDSVVLIEGIHALNPLVTYGLDYNDFFKVCMDVDSVFCNGEDILLSSREVRFIRRAIRDMKHRGASLKVTFEMWPGVCEGEDLYIKPFYPYADMMLNTVYSYEPLLYKPIILPMLMDLLKNKNWSEKADRLYRKLLHFEEIRLEKVPQKSLLQEFVG